jgi:uncharacterized protein (DUF433 family)
MVDNGVHVWAVIGDYLVTDGDIPPVMKDYDLSREAVEAALAYYRRHKAVIDNRLAANAGACFAASDLTDPLTAEGSSRPLGPARREHKR